MSCGKKKKKKSRGTCTHIHINTSLKGIVKSKVKFLLLKSFYVSSELWSTVKWSTVSILLCKLFLNKHLTEFILGRPLINTSISCDSADSLITHHRVLFLARNLNGIPYRLVSYVKDCLLQSSKPSSLGKEKNATRPSEYSVWSSQRPRPVEACVTFLSPFFFFFEWLSRRYCAH